MTVRTVAPGDLRCPHCRLTLAQVTRWSPEFCPRCLARSHVAVRLTTIRGPADPPPDEH